MNPLIQFDQPMDVGLFEECVQAASTGVGQKRTQADAMLREFKAHPDAWTRVDAILASPAASPTACFHAAGILLDLVKTRWKTLPRETCDGLKHFVVTWIMAHANDGEMLRLHRLGLSQLNCVLVDIIKQDWPRHWTGFVPEIVAASKINESLATNNMQVLRMLSEEVFDFSQGNLTQAKVRQLKQQFNQEFSQVFELCQFILEKSTVPGLVQATLDTLLRFLKWIPLGYVFETDLIRQLLSKFLPVPQLRNVTTKCLTEIVGLEVGDDVDEELFAHLYMSFMQIVDAQLGGADIAAAHFNGSMEDQGFISDLAMFLSTFFRHHRRILESDENTLHALLKGHEYLSRIGVVEEIEVFKICLEYWHHLSESLYQTLRHATSSANSSSLLLRQANSDSRARTSLPVPEPYANILSSVRVIMVGRMAKPEEVLIVKDPDTGEIVREAVPDTDQRVLYVQMQETLVFLTLLDCQDTHTIMLTKLTRQTGTEWSHESLNRLCWAIGSISGAVSDDLEKRFLVVVIKDLLGLCEMKRGKDHKAVVASDIMYVVGQYPAFLRQHWKFLRTVINKLFEFMHETHPGVREMAVDTFLKIARSTRRKFVVQQRDEPRPFIYVILDNLNNIMSDLESAHVEVFYEACATLIASHTNKDVRDDLTARLMARPNETWASLMAAAGSNVAALSGAEPLSTLIWILRLNHRATLALGHEITTQLGHLYLDLLNVYKYYEQCVSEAFATGHEKVLVVRRQRGAKEWILKLIAAYVERCSDPGLLRSSFLPPLFDAVLGQFGATTPGSRDAWVLTLMRTVIDKLGEDAHAEVTTILGGVFEPTLSMITEDFTNFPAVRTEFFSLLRSINKECFVALFAMPPQSLKLVVDALVYGMRHTERSISETALSAILELVDSVSAAANKTQELSAHAQGFWQLFLVSLVREVLAVLTDTMHKSGLKLQSAVLRALLATVESGAVTGPLSEAQGPDEANPQFLRRYIAESIASSFDQLTPKQIEVVVAGMFALLGNLGEFKRHLRDFLVQLKEFMTEANEELYLEEREEELRAIERAKLERAQAIPGLMSVAFDDALDQDEDD